MKQSRSMTIQMLSKPRWLINLFFAYIDNVNWIITSIACVKPQKGFIWLATGTIKFRNDVFHWINLWVFTDLWKRSHFLLLLKLRSRWNYSIGAFIFSGIQCCLLYQNIRFIAQSSYLVQWEVSFQDLRTWYCFSNTTAVASPYNRTMFTRL